MSDWAGRVFSWMRQDAADRPLTAWEKRVHEDVGASAPEATVQAEGAPAVPVTGLSTGMTGLFEAAAREHAARAADELAAQSGELGIYGEARHQFEPSRGRPGCAACGGSATGPIHIGEDLYLDAPHQYQEEPGRTAWCLCGRAALDELHRGFVIEATAPEAEPVFSEGGWLADDPEPVATPLRKPEPLPDGVLGYVVILPGHVLSAAGREGGTVAWLANADLMSWEHAGHMAGATGGTVAEVRAVER